MTRRTRRSCLTTLVLLAAWMLAPSPLTAQFIIPITGSVHDFTTATGASTAYKDTTSTATLCGTCHIPHHSGPVSGLPLWNHTLSTVTYSWSEATTLAGTTLPPAFNAPTGVGSMGCLSCHDGSVAIGSVINGASWGTLKITAGKKITGSGNADLTGNHPVGIPYPDQVGATYNSIVTQANSAEFKVAPAVAKIYGSTAGQKGIECGSCHDPHNAVEGFLRAPEVTLCADCHTK